MGEREDRTEVSKRVRRREEESERVKREGTREATEKERLRVYVGMLNNTWPNIPSLIFSLNFKSTQIFSGFQI